MELEELKNIWKTTAYRAKDEREIAAMLNGKSKSIINKIKRSIWIELSLTVFAVFALITKSITLSTGALKWTAISLLVILSGYTFYYVKKLLLLQKFNNGNENIRSNLKMLVKNLSSYLRFYKQSYMILNPVYFFLGLLFVGMERGSEQFLESLSKPKSIALLIFISTVFFLVTIWLVDWLLKKLYGNHIEKLKNLINELEE